MSQPLIPFGIDGEVARISDAWARGERDERTSVRDALSFYGVPPDYQAGHAAAGAAWAKRLAEDIDRKDWIETIRQRYGLVTIDGGLPRQPCGMTADGSYEGWCVAHLVSGRPESPAVWRLSNPPDPLEGLTDFQKLGYWNDMSIRERSAPGEDFERFSREIASRMRGEEVAGWRAASAPALPSPVADL